MKILAVSDVPCPAYYDHYTPGCLDEYDLILACGDLRRTYLEFLVTMAKCPLVYVRGNHDDEYIENPPEGCICADGDLVTVNGVRILGLGGSYRYRQGECMYTENGMRWRVFRLLPKIARRRGFDILLTHAPARGVNDFDTLSHRGFQCFCQLMDRYRPKYFVHGHIHRTYGPHIPQRSQYGDTEVINAYERCVIEL